MGHRLGGLNINGKTHSPGSTGRGSAADSAVSDTVRGPDQPSPAEAVRKGWMTDPNGVNRFGGTSGNGAGIPAFVRPPVVPDTVNMSNGGGMNTGGNGSTPAGELRLPALPSLKTSRPRPENTNSLEHVLGRQETEFRRYEWGRLRIASANTENVDKPYLPKLSRGDNLKNLDQIRAAASYAYELINNSKQHLAMAGDTSLSQEERIEASNKATEYDNRYRYFVEEVDKQIGTLPKEEQAEFRDTFHRRIRERLEAANSRN